MGRSRRFFLTVLVAVALPFPAAAETKPSPEEVVRAVVASGEVPLTVDSSCPSAALRQGSKDIGDYFSGLVAGFQDPAYSGMKLRIESVFAKEGYWNCTLMFEVADDKSPWRYGISFRLDDKTRKADPKSFRCPGCC